MKRPFKASFATAAAAAAFALAVSPLQAALISELGVLDLAANGGINPATSAPWAAGDTYRLVFVTSATTQATSADITTYNNFVQTVAASSTTFPSLGNATWNIVGSTETVDARDNTGTNPASGVGVPVFLMDGATTIALDNADIWDGISAAVNFDENNVLLNRDRVFTGTNPNGTALTAGGSANQPLGSFGDGLGGVRTGRSNSPNWTADFNSPATNSNSVFAMSEVLTVIPEPSSAALLGLGGLALLRRRR